MLVYLSNPTNRIHYIFDLIFKGLLNMELSFTSDAESFASFDGLKMSYGDSPLGEEPFQKAVNLLFERNIQEQELKPFDFLDVKAFFPVYSSRSLLPFDIFAASFYLVSRYEEYLPHIPDAHGRFKAESSCLYEMGVLHKPLVEIWTLELAKRLNVNVNDLHRYFKFIPTYDIDAAWAHSHKGLFRTIGGDIRDFLKGDKEEIKNRHDVIFHHHPDPFDSYEFQFRLQQEYHLNPIYFIHVGDYDVNDKSISIHNDAFRALIKNIGDYADVGIHPSYSSFRDIEKVRKEISRLSDVLNREVTKSRQHFLRISLPRSYQHLIELDIKDDYTMGYPSQVGFRAGISSAFLFFDLENDMVTPLTIHPFAIMDGTLKDYLNMNMDDSYILICNIIDSIKRVNGTFIYLTHNETLGGQKRWVGWPEMYEKMLGEMAK